MTQANVLPSDRVALEPCPWCGKQPRTVPDNSYGAAIVFCPDENECSVGPSVDADLRAGETLADAISAWNTRHRDASVRELVEALERCAVIVERNLYRQHEKVEDVPKIARDALAALAQPAPDDRAVHELIDEIIGAYNTTRRSETRAAEHILTFPAVQAALTRFRGASAGAALTPAPQPAEFGAQRPKRLKFYPDYIDDPAGLERFREGVKTHSGHDMADVNYNSLGRLIDTIERLRFERDAAQSIAAAIRGGAE